MSISVTPSLVSYTSSANVTTTGGLAVGTSIPVGTVLVATIGTNGSSNTYGVSDSRSNTWTQVGLANNTAATAEEVAVYVCQVTTALTSTDTITGTVGVAHALGFNVDLLTGASVTLDNGGTTPSATNSTGTPISLTAMTVTIGSIVIMAAIHNSNTGTFTAGSGFTKSSDLIPVGSATRHLGVEYNVATGTSVTPSITPPTSNFYAAVAISLFAATAATTTGGAVSFSGTAAGVSGAAASGSATLSGSAAGKGVATASGSASFGGSAGGVAVATASGSASFSGTATAGTPGNNATGATTLGGTAAGAGAGTASGSGTFSGTSAGKAAASPSGSASFSGTATGTAAGGSVTPLVNTAEGFASAGTLVTTSNSGGGSGDAFTSIGGTTVVSDNTHVMHGSMAYEVNNGSTGAAWVAWTYALATSTFTAEAYFYLTAVPTGVVDLIGIMSGTTFRARMRFATTGKLSVIDSTGSNIGSTTNSVPLNQMVRVQVTGVASATVGSMTVKLFDTPDSGTPTETFNPVTNGSANFGGTTDTVRYGVVNAGPATQLWMDDLGTNTLGTDIGPVASASGSIATAGTATGALGAVANGSAGFSGTATAKGAGAAAGFALFNGSAIAPTFGAATANGFINLTSTATVTPVLFFEPPYIDYGWPTGNRLFDRIKIHRGICVVTDSAGGWQNIEFPWLGLIETLIDGQDYFLGGHIYPVTQDIANSLITAGYTVTDANGNAVGAVPTGGGGGTPTADAYPGPTHYPSSSTYPGSS